jgi:exonuclease V gamma subunit
MVFAEYLAGRYDKAIETFGKMSHPGSPVQACLAACYAQLGRHDDAQSAAADFLKRVDNNITQAENWNTYWTRYCKFKDPAAFEHLLEGLSKAGLPG